MLDTLAEHTPLVSVLTRDGISFWNGLSVIRQSLCPRA
jgi:hypothetical protein